MLREAALAIMICTVLVVSLASGIGYLAGKKNPDGPVEEACEKVIKDKTGMDLDLSPGSPEAGKAYKQSKAVKK